MSEEFDDDALTPADAFALVGGETRFAILRALWDASESSVAFSDLQRAVGVADSAQFNYHLKKLADHFIRKTDEGYELRYAGRQVVRAAVAGTFTEHPERGPFPAGGHCASCGAGLVATYRDETLLVACPECGRVHSRYPFPPAALREREDGELLTAYNRWVRGLYGLAVAGVCHECGSEMTVEIRGVEAAEATAARKKTGPGCYPGVELVVGYRCGRCNHAVAAPVGMGLLDHPEVVTFYRERGHDLPAIHYWELPWAVGDDCTTLLSTDPYRARVDIDLEGDRLRVTLDDSLSVVEVECVDAPEEADAESAA
jgi:hypothetical protein